MRTEYLVKWKGYGDETTSWKPLANLSNADEQTAKCEAKLQQENKRRQGAVAGIHHHPAHAAMTCTRQHAEWYSRMEECGRSMPSTYVFIGILKVLTRL